MNLPQELVASGHSFHSMIVLFFRGTPLGKSIFEGEGEGKGEDSAALWVEALTGPKKTASLSCDFYFLLPLVNFHKSLASGHKKQILIPDWTYFHCPGATLVGQQLQFRGDQHFVTAEAGGRVSAWNTKMLLNGTASNRQYVCSQEAAQAWNEVKFMLCDDERVITGSTCGIVRVHWFYPQTTANTDKVDHEQP